MLRVKITTISDVKPVTWDFQFHEQSACFYMLPDDLILRITVEGYVMRCHRFLASNWNIALAMQ